MNGRRQGGLGALVVFCSFGAACSHTARAPLPRDEVLIQRARAPADAPSAGDAGNTSRAASQENADPKVEPAANGDVVYRAELEDRSISLRRAVRHLNWTCESGSCVAQGPALQISGKSCVSFGATVGAVVTRFQFGDQQLDSETLARCQSALRKLQSEGKFMTIAQQRKRALAQPSGLAAGEAYFEVTNYVGQMQLSDGSLRFVFADGSVALLRPDRTLFRFDAERRLSDSGRFVRWQSVGGVYAASDPISPEVLGHCSRTNGGIRIEPWQLSHASSLSPACYPHQEDFRAIFARESLPAPALTAARTTLFEAPYADSARWKQAARGANDPVVVGSAQSVPGYASEPARDMLEKVQTAVQNCARYVSDPTAQIRGEVLLIVSAFGAAKTVLVRRATYPDPERFSVCIEQRLMLEKYRATNELSVRVPFQLGDR